MRYSLTRDATFCRFLLVSLVVFAGCKKSGSDGQGSRAADAEFNAILGSWRWVLTVSDTATGANLFAVPVFDSATPASTGISQVLTFNPDGAWNLVQNGSGLANGAFKFTQVAVLGAYNQGPALLLDLTPAGGQDSLLNYTIGPDTLVLSQVVEVNGGGYWEYVRVTGQGSANPE